MTERTGVGGPLGLPYDLDVSVRITFLPSNRQIEISRGTTLLEAARRAGLPVAQACGSEGICARCGMQILDGAGDLVPQNEAEREAKARNRTPDRLRLACRVRPEHDLTVTAPYWSGT